MLWDIVYDFYVRYVFGGFSYENGNFHFNETYYIIGSSIDKTLAGGDSVVNLFGSTWTLGNYLSLIATLISMVAIVLICCALIKKIYNMCAHIIG